jgi:ABC-type phosphate/phosphonate transport system substrate-binding protein
MRSVRPIIAGTILVLLCGCATRQSSLKVAINDIYCTATACACIHDVAMREYTETFELLDHEYGIRLQPTYFIEPYQMEEAVLSGTYAAVLAKPWSALRLQQAAGADYRRVVDVLDPSTNRWLTGMLVVRADSPVQTMEELNGRHVCLGQPDAYEKHHAAKRLLDLHGVIPGKTTENASCGENLGMLLDEVADAAFVSDYALSADCAVDFAHPDDFRVLAHTEPIPLTSLMVDMNRVSDEQAARLQAALLTIAEKQPPESLLGKGFAEPLPWNPPELEQQP